MTLAVEYCDKELLIDFIRFNARFLELSIDSPVISEDLSNQYNELVTMVHIWNSRAYENNPDVDYANEILEQFNTSHNMCCT